MVRFDWDAVSMGRYLRESVELQVAAHAFAGEVADVARANSPVGGRGDRHPGEFLASIHTEDHKTIRGAIGARVVASPPWVEFGRRRRRPYRGANALGRARQVMSAPKRRV